MRDMAVPLVTHIQLVKCYRFTDTSHPKWHCPTRVTGSLHGHSYGELHGHQISGKKYAPPNYMTITGDILIYSLATILPSLVVIFPRKNDDEHGIIKFQHVSPSNPGHCQCLLGHLQGQAELRAERLLSEVLGSTEVKRRHCFDVEKYLVGDQRNNQTVG